MPKAAPYKIGCLISTILCVILVIGLTNMDRSILNILKVDVIWVLSFIVPCVFIYLEYDRCNNDSLMFFVPTLGSYVCGCIVTCWCANTSLSEVLAFSWKDWILFIIFSILFNFIPIGIISWEIMIANPSLIAETFGSSSNSSSSSSSSSNGGSSSTKTETTTITTTSTKPNYTLTGSANSSIHGVNSIFNDNPNDVSYDFYKNTSGSGPEFMLQRNNRKYEFFRTKDKGLFDHDYYVVDDLGGRHYADINRVKIRPGEPDIFLYLNGVKTPLFYKDFWKV